MPHAPDMDVELLRDLQEDRDEEFGFLQGRVFISLQDEITDEMALVRGDRCDVVGRQDDREGGGVKACFILGRMAGEDEHGALDFFNAGYFVFV